MFDLKKDLINSQITKNKSLKSNSNSTKSSIIFSRVLILLDLNSELLLLEKIFFIYNHTPPLIIDLLNIILGNNDIISG